MDAHAHVFPERLALAVRRFFDDHMGWGHLAYEGCLAEDVARYEGAAGVERFWALPYAHRPGVAASLNGWVAEAAEGLPGAVPGATFHPGDDDVGGLAREAFDVLGLRVGKLHCAVGGFDLDDPRLDPLWEVVSGRGVPVVVHVGRATQGTTTALDLDRLDAVATRHPAARLVLAHCGLPAIDAALDLLDAHPSLCGDVTTAPQYPLDFPVARMEAVADRLLLGSDCPNTRYSVETMITWVREAGFSDAAVTEILGGTAARLVPDG